jgi:hypothetical protein
LQNFNPRPRSAFCTVGVHSKECTSQTSSSITRAEQSILVQSSLGRSGPPIPTLATAMHLQYTLHIFFRRNCIIYNVQPQLSTSSTPISIGLFDETLDSNGRSTSSHSESNATTLESESGVHRPEQETRTRDNVQVAHKQPKKRYSIDARLNPRAQCDTHLNAGSAGPSPMAM